MVASKQEDAYGWLSDIVVHKHNAGRLARLLAIAFILMLGIPALLGCVDQSGPPPAPAPAPPHAISTRAWVSNPNPPQRSNVRVYGQFLVDGVGVSGVPMQATWYYRTEISTCSGRTDNQGIASCERGIGPATPGYPVRIEVAFNYRGATYTAQTSFTPRER